MSIDGFIQMIAQSRQHKTFYHFTDDRNLPSIREHGLLSHKLLSERGIRIPVRGGNDWSIEQDVARGLDRFVHLCFTRNHSMEYKAKKEGRLVSTTFLSVSPEVLKIQGTKITLDVSNQSGVKLITVDEALRKLDTEVIYQRTDWRDAKIKERLSIAERCEILVPDSIDLRYIQF